MKLQLSSNSVLLFDFGCVLVNLDKQRCINALKKIGCGAIASYVDEHRSEDLFHEIELGGSIENFCKEARRQSAKTDENGVLCKCEASDEDICWAWNQLLTGIDIDKLRYIKHLRDDLGFRTAILSNTNKIHWQKSVEDFFTADGLHVEDYFDNIFLSCDLGMVKPDDRIYQKVCCVMNVKPEDVVFFDDSEKNCEGACRNGIQAIHDPQGREWIKIIHDNTEAKGGYAAVIGNFDGLHRGHRYILENLKEVAQRNGLKPMVITFDKHPREVFDPTFQPSFITTQQEKVELLKKEVENVKVYTFDKDFANVSAHDFMEYELRDELGIRLLLIGYDNRFGKRNSVETFEHYQQYGKELGVKVVLANPIDVEGVRVSSSQIRHAIAEGRMDVVTASLGRPYSMTGIVVEGAQKGRKIGFPTANILPQKGKILPPDGVYASNIIMDEDGKQVSRKGMTNVGTRPTFDGSGITIETNIFGFNGDIYGKEIKVEFLRKVRNEQQFPSAEALKQQIEADKEVIENWGNTPEIAK